MEKYRLRQWYPNLHLAWSTTDNYEYDSENNRMYNRTRWGTIPITAPYLHSDFWELIEEEEPLFVTEDGVSIYGDMKTYLVHPNNKDDIRFAYGIWKGDPVSNGYKYFYHKENALAYVEKHKEKTLEDYENMLLRTNIDSINAREVCWFYHTLKVKEPKLYYTKILQLIADDLHDGRYIHIRGNTSYHLSNAHGVNVHCGGDEGAVYFKSNKLAIKARDILGGKVDYLFSENI